jgi:hypothetical protein
MSVPTHGGRGDSIQHAVAGDMTSNFLDLCYDGWRATAARARNNAPW